jgi:hypothetical protein
VNASGGQGGAGVMYEVDESGNIVWGPYNAQSQKGFRYECDYPGIIALETYMNTATTSCFIATSINDIYDNIISIFPNPTKDVITIKFKATTLQDIDIKIANSLGQNVFENTISNYIGTLTEKVNLSSFSEGLYFVKITTDNGQSITERIAHIK